MLKDGLLLEAVGKLREQMEFDEKNGIAFEYFMTFEHMQQLLLCAERHFAMRNFTREAILALGTAECQRDAAIERAKDLDVPAVPSHVWLLVKDGGVWVTPRDAAALVQMAEAFRDGV